MNQFRAVLLGLMAASVSGCVVSPEVGASYESYDKDYAPQMVNLASEVAEEVAVQYPGKLIFVDGTHKDGSFAELLRRSLASRKALAITSPMSDVKMRYALEEFSEGYGYLNLRFDDGSAKTKTFFLIPPDTYGVTASAGTVEQSPITESVPAAPSGQIEPSAIPQKAETSSAAVAQALNEASEKRQPSSLPAVHTVRKGECAYTIARKYGVPLKDFMAVNGGRRRCERIMPGQVMNLPQRQGTAVVATVAATPPSVEQKSEALAALEVVAMQNVPHGWKVQISDEAKQRKVHRPGNIPWKASIEAAAKEAGCQVEIAESSKVVFITLETGKQPAAESSPAVVSSMEQPVEQVWEIAQGSLRSQLGRWTQAAGYQLIWDTDTDLDMQACANFYGDFPAAISQLFAGLHEAGHALTATIYRGNNVLEVGDR